MGLVGFEALRRLAAASGYCWALTLRVFCSCYFVFFFLCGCGVVGLHTTLVALGLFAFLV